ncbi:MAG TPA: hypothetical protein VEA80_00280 [Vitreimonas sp.]|uniref:hypothetical protein n=1 Tax=Vitreimonas sp. TaxID=3069702 RepID=UPI002D2E2661|nr:hypothetical protein [Vitreimonas sp.]HYD85890.1 hypothetical protein [Vitreimonas sp.]
MNMAGPGALLLNMAMWVAVAIALAVTFTYLVRRSARERFPGGAKRYLAALIVQAAGFMIPIPVVLVLLLGQPIAPGLDVIIAVTVGVGVLALLHYAPVTGPLLKDLRRSRIEAAMERISGGRK